MLTYEGKFLNTANFDGDQGLDKILNKMDAENAILNTYLLIPSQEQDYLPGGHNAWTHASIPTMQHFFLSL